MTKKRIYLTEKQIETIKNCLLTENRESKNMSKARNMLYQQGYSQEDAQKTIEAIRNDIPNARLADCKFLPGVTRMYLNRELSDGNTIMKLNKTLKYVASDAHVNEYDNNLNGMPANELVQRFAGVQQQDADASRAESYGKKYTRNTAYTIVRIPDAETAAKYGRYTSWCVTHDEHMYDSYTADGTGLFYFCLRNGFENEQPIEGEGCPLDSYGLSMIAVSVTMNGELNTCTCRWNHDNGGNDNIMDKTQIEELLGVNFYEEFKPYTREELHARGVILFDEVPGLLAQGVNPKKIFDYVSLLFENGYARVRLNDKFNFINIKGELVFPNQWFDHASNFYNGYATVRLNNKENLINTNGELVSTNQWFNYVGAFENGYARVILNDKCNFINTNGELLWNKPVNEWFDNADPFSNGYAWVLLNDEWYYLRSDGILCDYYTKKPLANQQMLSETKKIKRIYLTENQVSELQQKIQQAREETDKHPTEGQKQAGNYKMGRVRILGYNIAIENPKGTIRSGKDKKGNKWQVTMKNDYGYFTHTLGYDGDAVDVFLGSDFDKCSIFAIDQKIDGKFDETKIMFGFKNEQEAKDAYMSNYNPGWKGFWKITEVSNDVFHKWLYDGYKQKKPFFEYVEIKKKKLNEHITKLFNNQNLLLKESNFDDYYEEGGIISVLNDFIDDMESGRKVQNWLPLINPAVYQRALQIFTKQGNLDGFPNKYVYSWIGTIMRNTVKLDANTELAGHSNGIDIDFIAESRIAEFIQKHYNMKVIDWDYDCTVSVTPNFIIEDLVSGKYRLDYDEKEYIDNFIEKNKLYEDAIHQMGSNKGQTAMFLSQPELDHYDHLQSVKTRDNDIQGIIDIYNYHNGGETETRASFGNTGTTAKLGENGNVLLTVDLFVLLDKIGLYDWMMMPDGSDAWSDFGLRPLFEILSEYDDNFTSPEDCLVLINRALDVSHPRGDMASIFIEGGSKTLSQISNRGYLTEHYNQDWELEEIRKNEHNGIIKLYHNTRMMNLGDILSTGELDTHQHHSEGHGNMLFFTVHPDAWGNECKISIEVPVSEFTKTGRFRFVNSDSVITEENIPISEFNFKIEKIQYFDYDRIVEILTGDNMELKEYLLLKYFQEYDYMWWIKQWFLNNLGLKEEDLL